MSANPSRRAYLSNVAALQESAFRQTARGMHHSGASKKTNKPFSQTKQAVWLKRYGSMPPALRRNEKNPQCNAKERQQAASSSTCI